MESTAQELSTVSNVNVHLQILEKKHIICSLTYEDFEYENCSVT